MKNISLSELNKAVQVLIETKSEKQLYSQISETAKTISNASFVKFFLFDKERLKSVYSSDKAVKNNSVVIDKKFNKVLSSKDIVTLNRDDLKNIQFKHLPNEITLVTIVPLINTQHTLGFLFLYFVDDKKELNQAERDLLALYSHTVVLALDKIQLQEESQRLLRSVIDLFP